MSEATVLSAYVYGADLACLYIKENPRAELRLDFSRLDPKTPIHSRLHISFQAYRNLNNMESQPLIAREPRRSRHSVYLRQVWTKAYPFLIAFYVTTIIILSLSGVLATKRRDNVPDTQNPVADNNSIASLQQAYHTLHCHSQQTTATLLALTPVGLFGTD